MGWKSVPLYYDADALRKVVLSAGYNQILLDLVVHTLYSVATEAIAIPISSKAMTR